MSSVMTTTTTITTAFSLAFGNMTGMSRPESEDKKPQLISDNAMYYINIYLYFMVGGGIAVFGLVNNVVNMVIFHRIGLKDSMNVGLMALSVNDFFVSLLGLVRLSFFMWDLLCPESPVKLFAVNRVSTGWLRDSVFLGSTWLTAFLSVERCVCVVFPFKVKDVFTRFRSVVAVVVIYVVIFTFFVPVFLFQRLGWVAVKVDSDNGTVWQEILQVQTDENWPHIQLYIDIATSVILYIPAQALVLISGIWMVYGLRVSSRVRTTSSVYGKEDNKGGTKKESNLSFKERRLVKVVLIIAVILVVCNVPRFLAVNARQIMPSLTYGSGNKNLRFLLFVFANVFSVINASVNIFVYLTVNVSYQQKFRELFCGRKPDD